MYYRAVLAGRRHGQNKKLVGVVFEKGREISKLSAAGSVDTQIWAEMADWPVGQNRGLLILRKVRQNSN
jgi:hypothetical protein